LQLLARFLLFGPFVTHHSFDCCNVSGTLI